MSKITDTSSIPNMFAPLVSGTGFIEAMEKAGQTEAVQAVASLPSDITDRPAWEALGVVFGEPDSKDPVFCEATLPAGWSKRATDHSMHNDIIDAAGNRRGSFFYKAAFYDRSALLRAPLTRYSVRSVPGDLTENYYDGAKTVGFEVHDSVADSIMFSTSEEVTAPSPAKNDRSPENDEIHREWWDEHSKISKRMESDCRAWADEKLPGWEDPAKHWPEAG